MISTKFFKLKEISSTNEKIAYVAANKDDDLFIECLKFLLDSSIVTGISAKKWGAPWEQASALVPFDLRCMMQYVQNHNTGRDIDLAILHTTAEMIDEDPAFITGLMTKNFPLGIDAKGVNKAIPNCIPTFDVMLANALLKLDEKAIKRITADETREFAITTKLDGFRCICIKRGESVKLISRQGKLFEGLTDVENELRKLPGDFVLDSEIIVSDRKRFPSKMQYKETSKLITTKEPVKTGLTVNVFDYIPIDEWDSKVGKTPWNARYEHLKKLLINYTDSDKSPVYAIPVLYRGTSLESAYNLLAKARENNEEGVMLRFTDSVYEFKRSNELLKLKVMNELDAVITGCLPGSNKYEGTLGALTCEINHPVYGYLSFKVGSGFSDDERAAYWEQKDELIGRTIEVQYFEVTQNQEGGYSVRFPVHKCIKDPGVLPNN